MREIIERKKRGMAMTDAELRYLCRGAVDGSVPDYQLAAWLMAAWFQGLSRPETLALTRAMVATGDTLDWADIDRPVVDKHSTGGVGDKTSLVLVPLVAAAGLAFAKMSGRGLGHTGGTLDKLESISGFRVDLTPDQLHAQVERIGCALSGQSPGLVPADGALYALRDVTGTVDSVPLIASSVMSKKLAAGAGAIVLDVKYGSGAFMPDIDGARKLAREMVAIGTGAGRRVRAVISSMEQPLGQCIGNALEVKEAIETLRGRGPDDLWELTLALGVQLLLLSGVERDADAASAELTRLRDSGEGLLRLQSLIEAQGGDPEVVNDPDRFPTAAAVVPVRAIEGGWVARLDARAIADAVVGLGGGRRVKGESIDAAAGVVLQRKVGERISAGDIIAEVHAVSPSEAADAVAAVAGAYGLVGAPEECPSPGPFEIVDG